MWKNGVFTEFPFFPVPDIEPGALRVALVADGVAISPCQAFCSAANNRSNPQKIFFILKIPIFHMSFFGRAMMPGIDKRQLLSTHYLFRDMEAGVIERLVSLGVTRHLEDDETLFLKGDPGDALYGVLAGRIRISASVPSGKEVILSIMEAGNIFGEIALLDGTLRTADTWGVGQSQLFKIDRGEFLDFLDREPSLYAHLLQMVCDRVRSTNEFVEDYVFWSLPARLAKRLLSLSKFFAEAESDDGDPRGVQISQSELGQLMGRTRETINRQLQVWRKKGWIELPHGHIKIINHEALLELIDDDYEG